MLASVHRCRWRRMLIFMDAYSEGWAYLPLFMDADGQERSSICRCLPMLMDADGQERARTCHAFLHRPAHARVDGDIASADGWQVGHLLVLKRLVQRLLQPLNDLGSVVAVWVQPPGRVLPCRLRFGNQDFRARGLAQPSLWPRAALEPPQTTCIPAHPRRLDRYQAPSTQDWDLGSRMRQAHRRAGRSPPFC